jgi:hypothetical protein
MSAPYCLDIQMTDDETFMLPRLEIVDAAGSPLVWEDFTFKYSLVGGSVSLLLTEGSGVTIDTGSNVLIITTPDPTYRLPVGVYKHGLLVTHDGTLVTKQYLDGTVTVSEGNFA